MMSTVFRAKLMVLAVFVLGAVTGALLSNVYETRLSADVETGTQKKAEREVGQFYDFLGLTAEQRLMWDEVLEDSKPEFDKIFEENRRLTEPTRARTEALRDQTRDKLRAILTEEQKKLYDEFNERRRQRQSQSRQN